MTYDPNADLADRLRALPGAGTPDGYDTGWVRRDAVLAILNETSTPASRFVHRPPGVTVDGGAHVHHGLLVVDGPPDKDKCPHCWEPDEASLDQIAARHDPSAASAETGRMTFDGFTQCYSCGATQTPVTQHELATQPPQIVPLCKPCETDYREMSFLAVLSPETPFTPLRLFPPSAPPR